MEKIQVLKESGENVLMKFLGVRIEEASAERVVLTMEVTSKVHQYVGIMHGGVSVYLCETAASIGAVAAADLEKVSPVGVEINANHLRAVSKGMLRVEAQPIYTGRTMAVWGVNITNDKEKLICTSRCTLMLRSKPASM